MNLPNVKPVVVIISSVIITVVMSGLYYSIAGLTPVWVRIWLALLVCLTTGVGITLAERFSCSLWIVLEHADDKRVQFVGLGAKTIIVGSRENGDVVIPDVPPVKFRFFIEAGKVFCVDLKRTHCGNFPMIVPLRLVKRQFVFPNASENRILI